MTVAPPSRRAQTASPIPVVFGPPGHQLFGMYHPPDTAGARAAGVVLCNPLGYEAMCVHGMYRRLAERLAAAGVHALRFDYHGTGDSSGQADDPARVRAWLDSIGAAVEELQAIAGVSSVDLMGVRFGATLAAVAAAERRDVRGLVLWAPCATGRAYVRELRAFRLLQQRGATPLDRGGEEVAGYLFEEGTVLDLRAIDLLAGRARIVERALVVSRDDLPAGDERLVLHLQRCGVEAASRVEPGYARMMRDPQDSVVPAGTLDAIVEWVNAPRQSDPPRPSRGFPSASVLTAWSHHPRCVVREEPQRFGEAGHLFGILTEPSDAVLRRETSAVIFLNVGANHHVGPNRLYVSLCRDLAALGYLTFRFDTAGLGDSSVRAGAAAPGLAAEESVDDVRAAVSLLWRARRATRVVLVGICSGAHLAFHATMVDPRVVGQILINPQNFARPTADGRAPSRVRSFKSTRYYIEALSQRAVWAHALRGELDLLGVAGALGRRLVRRLGAERRSLLARWNGRPVRRNEVERAFCTTSDRGVSTMLIFSANDGGLDTIEEQLGEDGDRAGGRRNIRLSIVEGADHTFTPLGAQRALRALIEGFVADTLP